MSSLNWLQESVSDSRVSRSVDVLKTLLKKSVGQIAGFDPACDPADVQKEIFEILESDTQDDGRPSASAVASEDPYSACHLADAILILTDWDYFRCAPASPNPVTSGAAGPTGSYGSSSIVFLTDGAPSKVGPPVWKLSIDQGSEINDNDKAFLRNPKTFLKPESEHPSEGKTSPRSEAQLGEN